MAWDSEGLGGGLLVNLIATPVLLVVAHYWLHKNHLLSIDMWRVFRPIRPSEPPTFFNFGGKTGAQFLTWTDKWVEATQNAEAVLYLKWLKWLALVFGTISFFTCTIMIPVNVTAGNYREEFFEEHLKNTTGSAGDFEPGIGDWTTQNVHPGSERLWADWGVMLLVGVEVWAMIVNLLYTFRDMKARQKPPRTAQMWDCVKTEQQVMNNIPEEMHSTVTKIDLPRAPPKGMLDVIKKRTAAIRKLEHFYALAEQKKTDPLDPKFGTGCCKKENPVVYWRGKVDKYDKELVDLKKLADETKAAGGAFVTFESSEACVNFLVTKEGKRCRFAPPGKTVLWDNIGMPLWRRSLGTLAVCAGMFFGVMFWTALLAVLQSADELVKDLAVIGDIVNVHPEVAGLVTTYLPIILLAIIMFLLPIVMRMLTQYVEGVGDMVEREYYVLRKYYLFLLFAAVILLAAASGAGNTGLDALADADKETMEFLFISMIVPIGGYFPMVIVQGAFMGNMVKLLRIGDVIVGRALATIAITEWETQDAYKMRAFYFSQEYGSALLIYSMAMLFGVHVPYLPFFACFYFIIRFLVDRATLIDVYPRCRPSDLRAFPFVMQSCLAMLTTAQVFMIILAELKGKRTVMWFACVPLAISILGHLLLYANTKYIMSPRFYKEIQDGLYEKKENIPHIANMVASCICSNEEPSESIDEEPEEEMVDRYGYGSPCQAYNEPETFDHEAMAEKKWLVIPAKDMDPAEVGTVSVCDSSTYYPGHGGLYLKNRLKEVSELDDDDEAECIEDAVPLDGSAGMSKPKPTEPIADEA